MIWTRPAFTTLALTLALATLARAEERPRAKKRLVLVTISKETTVITGPLRKDGYPDYLAALNRHFSQGVTPENNAAVLYWEAMGPREIKPELRAQYFEMLKMPAPPEESDDFVTFDQFVERLKAINDPRLPPATPEGREPIWQQMNSAETRPWSKDEFPVIADWLDANAKPLKLLVRASRRPRWYSPLICADKDEGRVIAALAPLNNARVVGPALVARAMLRLHAGAVEQAWDDLLACHRLARLVGRGPALMDAFRSIGIDRSANEGDTAMLKSGRLTSAQATKICADLTNLQPLPRMIEKVDLTERYTYLDCVSSVVRGVGVEILGGRKPNAAKAVAAAALIETYDWDLILRMGNSWYDRMVAARHLQKRSEQQAALVKIDESRRRIEKINDDPVAIGFSFLFGGLREGASVRMGNQFISMLLPSLTLALNSENRAVMHTDLTRLGFSLAAFHADHGAYPERLNELVPRYVAKVPEDIFAADGALHYRREATGYLLYSVGPNGRDDGGHTREEAWKAKEQWDDISIRVP